MGKTPGARPLQRLVARCRRQVLSPVEETDPAARRLIAALDASPHFRRDGRAGRIFHPGSVSYREIKPTNSLHVILDSDRVSAHVDDVSPLRCDPGGTAHYSWLPVLRHNVAGMLADLGRRVQGSHGDQRCNLTCDAVWVDDEDGIADLVRAAGSQPPGEPDGSQPPSEPGGAG